MTDKRGFLGDLMNCTCPIPKYTYQGKERFLRDFQHEIQTPECCCEWLVLTNVNKETFESDFLKSDQHPFSSVSSYDNELQALILRMAPSQPHDAAVLEFGVLLHNAIAPHELKLRTYGGAHQMANGCKVPDQVWRPLRLPKDRALEWPSIALEVSFSETSSKLISDIRCWLRGSGGDVKIVFTVDIDRNMPKIAIEQWVMKMGRPSREQRVEITKSPDAVKITNHPLEVSFERVFLCPPSTDGESILSVRGPALQSYAEAIWESQGFKDVERF
ncbi:uncharacterized protein BDV14DRAFT_199531 [Aspergillus stella-maris]|uniref:uncharacterized protein n=1 Tax=Aspergillus stella-maris TaxID=1810926 RepID=UPI003CCD942B